MNGFSQYGEDEIIANLVNDLGIKTGCFVEFGAWDGRHLSNCCALLERGWSGCFIEGDPKRFQQLQKNFPQKNVKTINRWVSWSGLDKLDLILKEYSVSSIDLLSIDIDGDDLVVWQSVEHYRSKIVVIEYNPTIPADVIYVNPQNKNHGNSMAAIVQLATEKNYVLSSVTPNNLIFVDRELPESKNIVGVDISEIADKLTLPRYFFAYDGTLLTSHPVMGQKITELFLVPWSSTVFAQPIPRCLRGYAPHRLKVRARRIWCGMIVILVRPFSVLVTLPALLARKDRANHD